VNGVPSSGFSCLDHTREITAPLLPGVAIYRRRQDTHASFVDSVVPMGSSP